MTALHLRTRARLAALLAAAAPTDPTVCTGWQARHLAAHLHLREHAPLVAAGVVVPALAGRTAAAVDALADRSADPVAYAALVAQVAAPPARLSPFSWAGRVVDVVEHVVHAEDVRRGAGADDPTASDGGPVRDDADRDARLAAWAAEASPDGGPDGGPGTLADAGLGDALWRGVRTTGRLAFRRPGPGVVVVLPDGRRAALRRPAPGRGTVVVRGGVVELQLWLSGRGRVADVTVTGDPADARDVATSLGAP
ncbi:TIGR03085 family metal-binding protein [Cellulomonas marina]|uniref:TIGR03085 family protein n=1 Tax=Cellulomonas marina TaxID=988821 RepID=A0A1I0ZTF7_9CELL|nr:TIGR03085 family metal-binding protein [Cellulomonas marina]GIG28862.1 hypothetical protein Cma02nite_14620 [Cellulomonas marina]SFB27483.1 TIGR03085 family protein [Cellulomonas marina]